MGVVSHSLLQGIFLTQGLNPGLLHCRQILYYLSHWGNMTLFFCICDTLPLDSCPPFSMASLIAQSESACNAGNLGSVPWLGRSPGEGNGSPLQYSCLKIPMGRGAWKATVHGVTSVRYDLAAKPTSQPPGESSLDTAQVT